ncbi:hypothetical protein A2419_00795 [Candidatus Adlerbacteria bacterium RIFOXYC1_FULL_48_26]|uniref:YcaO domain-containing protein n=1 Tax=Candidatus Adlerbacteria bacterium RIFOXYC1_FULL_48_26 TaxID=1797247 RepID=A0A1F4Y1Y9_9BACT|nr:MAG: hypothetical protein A2419_00795 [Candidatus Adlerbacteria bacterium RIFOXYC1_FULL_48_26]
MQWQKQTEFFQQYVKPSSQEKVFSVQESIDAFLKPCGRFKSPLPWYEILELKILRSLSSSKIFNHIAAFPDYEVLPNWQILLNYLASQKFISKPSFSLLLQRNDLPNINRVKLESRVTEEVTDGWSLDTKGFGSNVEIEEAYSKSVGEFLERYTTTLYRSKNLKHSSYNKLVRAGARALSLDVLPKFLPWQMEEFKEFAYSNDTQLRWAEATELISGKRTYVPAQLVFWSYNRTSANEPYLQDSTTNGQAGHFTFEESVLGSIYELIERDALLIFWLNTISPKRIALETIDDPAIKARIKLLQKSGLKLFFLDTTTDLEIPSCVCVVLDDRGAEPRVALGGSAGFDIYKNLNSSLNEAMSVAQHSITYDLPLNYRPFLERNIGMKERMGAWHGTEMLERFDFFVSGEEIALLESRYYSFRKIFPSKQSELEEVKKMFKHKGAGYELYCYRVQHSVLDKLGYVVTKVIVPKLVPLHLQERMATLGAQRLQEVPKVLGYEKTTLNPWPHPFS